MKNYLAITIGPIYASIESAQKVRELFGASYFFSLFMRLVLKELMENKGIQVIVPHIEESLLDNGSAIGFFQDRFIAKTSMEQKVAKEALNKAIDNALDKIVEISNKNVSNGDQTIMKEDLENYLTIHKLIISDDEAKKVDSNLIFAVNKLLDAKELHYPFTCDPLKGKTYICSKDEEDKFDQDRFEGLSPVNLFGFRLHRWKRGFSFSNELARFKSTVDLAKDKDGSDLRYYAVVTADGDKMGDKIKRIFEEEKEDEKKEEKLSELSKRLFEFFFGEKDDADIRELTKDEFGGELIFAGGDDILALMPVKYGDRTVLDYITELSGRFRKYVGEDVSLSFGVNIVYHKYPMKKAIAEAFDLLHDAKDWGDKPNTAKIMLVKHSGQKYDTIHHLNEKTFESFKEMLLGTLFYKENRCPENERPCFDLPHAVHHTLDEYRYAIIETLRRGRNLEPFFEKIFNDARKPETKAALTALRHHIEAFDFSESEPKNDKPDDSKNNKTDKPKENFNRIYGDLNIIKFLRGDRDDLSA
jgi:CRISPR-associated protein Cmr2